jgi:hypothetical protein
MAGSRTLKLSILADVDDLKKKLDTGANEVEGFGGKLEKFGKVAAAAFAAAAAAAAAYAGKLLVEGVQAAIEDEAAQAKLAATLKNVTGATDAQVASVEKQILQLSLANGIADDKLRPAYERLARATGDVTKSNELLKLALDISAGTGRDLESVTNALGKAYEGNTGALTRLGVGITAAEAKSLTFDEVTQQLANTFEGQAAVKANTFAGQVEQLRVRFDEAKESVGAALLPKLTEFLNLVVDKLIPAVQDLAKKAFDPVKKAIADNKEELKILYDFAKDFLLPFIGKNLVDGFVAAGKAISLVIKGISAGVDAIQAAVNGVIAAINLAIKAYNALPATKDIALISKVGTETTKVTSSNTVASASLPFGGTRAIGGQVSGKTAYIVGERGPELFVPQVAGNIIPNDKTTGNIVVNVYAPSMLDEEGFTRAVITALNNSQSRAGAGAGQLVL